MQQRIAEIQARAEAAPPGPWRVVGADNWRLEGFPQVEYNNAMGSYICAHDDKDADFIAHAREDIPFLLSALQSATARAERAEQDSRRLAYLCDLDLDADNGLYVHCGEWSCDGTHYGDDYRAAIDAAIESSSPPPGASK